MGKLKSAKWKKLEKELRAAEKAHDFRRQIEINNSLGNLCRAAGDQESAVCYFETSVNVCSQHDSFLDESFALRALAEISASNGDRSTALEHIQLFRKAAAASENHSQIQLAYHVSAHVFHRLWDSCGPKQKNRQDLEQALHWCKESVNYLKLHGNLLEADNLAEAGREKLKRKANIDSLFANIYANMGNKEKAEAHWESAYSFAVRNEDATMLHNLNLTRLDFRWIDPVESAQRLLKNALVTKKGAAFLELAQERIFVNDFEGALDDLVMCLVEDGKHALISDDKEKLNDRLIFVHKHLARVKFAENEANGRSARRLAYDQVADDLLLWNRKETRLIALQFYERVFELCSTDLQRIPALTSLGNTARDVGKYTESLYHFNQMLDLERKLGAECEKILSSEVLIFDVKCEGKIGGKKLLSNDFDHILEKIPRNSYGLKGDVFGSFGKYLAQIGENGDSYLSKARELDEKERETNPNESMDGGGQITGSDRSEEQLVLPSDEDILASFMEEAKQRKRLADLEAANQKREKINRLRERRLRKNEAVRQPAPDESDSYSEDEQGYSVRKTRKHPCIESDIEEPMSPEPERPSSSSSWAGRENVAPSSGGSTGSRPYSQSAGTSRNSGDRLGRALTQVGRSIQRVDSDTPTRRKRKVHSSADLTRKRRSLPDETRSGRSSAASVPLVGVSPSRSPSTHSSIDQTLQRHESSDVSQRPPSVPAAQQAPPTPAVKPITVKITFLGVNGKKIKTKMFPFPSDSTIVDVYNECLNELPAPHLIEIQGADDCEMHNEIPLQSLDVPRLLNCHLKLSSAEMLFKMSCPNAPASVVSLLKEFDKSSKLDLAQHEVDDYKNDIFKAVLGSKQQVKQLILDNVELCVDDVPFLARMLPTCHQFKADATGITDDIIDSLVTALDSPTALRTLNLSSCELQSGRSMSCLLRLAPSLQSLHLSNLELKDGSRELMETICGLSSLTVLNLSYNASWMTAELTEKLAENCSERLRELALTSCNLDKFEFKPTYLPALTRLSVSDSQFSHWEALTEWISVGKLEWMDLSCTSIEFEHLENVLTARDGRKVLTVRAHRCRELESDLVSVVRKMVQKVDNSTQRCPLIFEFSPVADRKIRQMTAFGDKFLVERAI